MASRSSEEWKETLKQRSLAYWSSHKGMQRRKMSKWKKYELLLKEILRCLAPGEDLERMIAVKKAKIGL